LGGESVLRHAGLFNGSMDEAYGALRDLELEVELITMDENGNISKGTTEFGSQPLKFNPTFDSSSNDMNNDIQENSQPPSESFNF